MNMPLRPGVRIDALGQHHAATAQCQNCRHTAPIEVPVILAKRHLARRGLLQDLHALPARDE
jgi:hypothetical protein